MMPRSMGFPLSKVNMPNDHVDLRAANELSTETARSAALIGRVVRGSGSQANGFQVYPQFANYTCRALCIDRKSSQFFRSSLQHPGDDRSTTAWDNRLNHPSTNATASHHRFDPPK